MLRLIFIAMLLALLGGCIFDTSGAPYGTAGYPEDQGTDSPDTGSDLPKIDLPVHDLPVVDLPVVDLPVHDLPVVDLPVHDLPVVDLPVHDQGPTDLPSQDAPPTDLAVGPETSTPDQWVDPPDLWPAVDKSFKDMAKPDKSVLFPDFAPAPDVKAWPDMKPKDLKPATDVVPGPPDIFPLPTCAQLFQNDTKGYKLCAETATTCRFYHDEGAWNSASCSKLCKKHACMGAWDTSGGNKCSYSNGASCSKGFRHATCLCSKW